MNYNKKLRGWSLRDAAEAGQLLEVTCQFCRTTYRFIPRDLLKLTKDVSLDRLASRFRCVRCNRGDYMSLKVVQIWGVGNRQAYRATSDQGRHGEEASLGRRCFMKSRAAEITLLPLA
ncbi:hypothetical protein [Rhizobium bangladeshense]|uniref:hypothetical protein n=1 Tax=Rhizobium bangladeshense TaxID=1138189 RepID=UPI0021B0EF59|nr:hypothetical protein [Rhizobium bangladeshense]